MIQNRHHQACIGQLKQSPVPLKGIRNFQYYISGIDCMPWRHRSHLFWKQLNYNNDPIYTTGVHLI